MSLKSLWTNFRKRGLKDITNPKKIKNYLDGSKIKKEGIHLDYEEIMSYSEQLVYRSIQCRPCFKNGACLTCGCPKPLSSMVYDFVCEDGNFGEMLPPKEWEQFKKDQDIIFQLKS